MLPNTSSSTFEKMTPTFQIPSTVILNQMNKEGTILVWVTNRKLSLKCTMEYNSIKIFKEIGMKILTLK